MSVLFGPVSANIVGYMSNTVPIYDTNVHSTGFVLYVWRQLFCNSCNTWKYGEWAVVTGAANGIGRSMARHLAARGHSIIAIDIDEFNLAQTKLLLEREPNVGRVEFVAIDLSDTSVDNYSYLEKQIHSLMTTKTMVGGHDVGILVNCAGLATKKAMIYDSFTVGDICRTVNVNVLATALMTRMLLPGMVARKRGLIVNVSSILANVSQIFMGVYGPTKAFVSEFSRFLQLEYSQHSVDIVYLTPCAVRTGMLVDKCAGEHESSASSSLPSSIMVSPDAFAKSALNAIGSGINCYSGYWTHGLWKLSFAVVKILGLMPLAMRMFFSDISRRTREESIITAKDPSVEAKKFLSDR